MKTYSGKGLPARSIKVSDISDIMKKYSTVLTIAGSDSVGGAGNQADIKAISATGSYAASAITAVTVQNTLGVSAVHPVPVEIITGQIRAVLSDIGADAVKIGMLNLPEVVMAVAGELDAFGVRNVVLDPVMVATSGDRLISEDSIDVLVRELVPRARVITPNIPEAEILSGEKISSHSQMEDIARRLAIPGKVSVLLKAGHLEDSETLTDIFYNAESGSILRLPTKKVHTPNTHGTGCTLSSSLASFLAQGLALDDAVRAAHSYLASAILSGAQYSIGSGHGPVNHFWK